MGEVASNGMASDPDRPKVGGGLVREREEAAGLWPIRRSLTVAGITALLGLAGLMTIVLGSLGFPHVQHSKSLPLTQLLDVLKLVLGTVAGVGALFALVTAYRRQCLAEAAHDLAEATHAYTRQVDAIQHAYQERIARNAEHDAAERRITELYNAAAEQLGSDKAPVRLTALYTLERLANGNPTHQQTTVNIICAYLRMPHSVPDASGPAAEQQGTNTSDSLVSLGTAGPDPREEHQVRLTAQRILYAHLQPAAASHWPDIDLDLTGATLTNFTLKGCDLRAATFSTAKFSGSADFNHTKFSGDVSFTSAKFSERTDFMDAVFSNSAYFINTKFSTYTFFQRAEFRGHHSFRLATFNGVANLVNTKFTRGADLTGARVADPSDPHELPPGWRIAPMKGLDGRIVEDGVTGQGSLGQSPPD